MARNASIKPDSGSTQSSTLIGFDLSAANDNMAALPGQLFYSTQIPVCLWFLAKNNALGSQRLAAFLKMYELNLMSARRISDKHLLNTHDILNFQ
jgi:type I restriction-modification system DNA methylase subunit